MDDAVNRINEKIKKIDMNIKNISAGIETDKDALRALNKSIKKDATTSQLPTNGFVGLTGT